MNAFICCVLNGQKNMLIKNFSTIINELMRIYGMKIFNSNEMEKSHELNAGKFNQFYGLNIVYGCEPLNPLFIVHKLPCLNSDDVLYGEIYEQFLWS